LFPSLICDHERKAEHTVRRNAVPISFGSINTGLPPNIVEQLMEAERIPIKNMQVQKGKSEAKMKLVEDLQTKLGDIRKNLGELSNTRGFADIKLISGDQNAVGGTVDPALYQPGNWNVEVVSLPQKAGAITNGFPDKDKTEVGVGYLRFKTPDGNKDVYVNGDNNTLEGVVKAVNAAKVGVRASVINDRKSPDAPFKLVLTADNAGADKSVEYPRIYMLDGDQDLYFDSEMEAKNGVVKVDGFEFEINDNVVKDVIPGVTLELKQATPGRSVNVTVKEDREVVSGKIKNFVDAFNGVLSFIQTQNKMDKTTDTSKTLGGDGMLRSVETRLRQLVQMPQMGVKGDVHNLSQIGIAFNRAGTLEFDQKKFDAVLNQKPESVQNFFIGDGFSTGFVASIRRETNNLLNPNFGAVANRAKGLKEKIDQMDQRIADKERQLAKKEEVLRNKFSRLEESMSKIKAQGAQLGFMGGGQLIPGAGGGGGG
jgi:flagellar hook-associated protein 2